jgi:hypothetical protein
MKSNASLGKLLLRRQLEISILLLTRQPRKNSGKAK